MSLAAFDISKHIKNGVTIEPKYEQTTGTIRSAFPKLITPHILTNLTCISHVKPFKCSITPRSQKAEGLIKADVL